MTSLQHAECSQTHGVLTQLTRPALEDGHVAAKGDEVEPGSRADTRAARGRVYGRKSVIARAPGAGVRAARRVVLGTSVGYRGYIQY